MISLGLDSKDGDDFVSDDDDEDSDEEANEQVESVFQRGGDVHVGERSDDEDADENQDKEQFQVCIIGDEEDQQDPQDDDQGDFLRQKHAPPLSSDGRWFWHPPWRCSVPRFSHLPLG